ncbi:MAG: hypothetical protein V1827_03425 [Candidatus Micrarchaeota archaeon]
MPDKFLEEWLYKGPALDEIISSVQDDRRRGRARTVIVIPTNGRKDILSEHIRRLERQTRKDFDLILIHGIEDKFIDAGDISALQMRRSSDLGSAGAFYAGERCALDEGYENILLADDDCWPDSDDFIGRMIDELGKYPLIKPLVRFWPPDNIDESVVHQYGGFRREVLEKAGLNYIPLYSGGDDFNLEKRILDAGFCMRIVDARATHPATEPFFLFKPSKLHLYSRGLRFHFLMSGQLFRAWFVLFIELYMAMAFIVNGFPGTARSYFRTALATAMASLKHPDMADGTGIGARSLEDGEESGMEAIESEDEAKGSSIRFYIGDGGWSGFLMLAFLKLKKIARGVRRYSFRRLLFKKRVEYIDMIPVMLSSQAAFAHNGKIYEIRGRRGWIRTVFENAFLSFTIPPIALLAAAFTASGLLNIWTRGIDSSRYGVGKKGV